MRRKKKNPVIEKLRIEDYASEGRSLGRVEGKVIFVERSVPGDVVDVQVTRNKKDWAEGYPVRIHEFSPKRVTPFCAHFGDCGGCQWQTVDYSEQARFKEQQVRDALQRIGKIPLPPAMPILAAKQDRNYRNKLEYTFGTQRFIPAAQLHERNEDGSLLVEQAGWSAGFHARGFFDKIVNITQCHLQPEPTNLIRNIITQYALEKNLSFYDIRAHHGFLRNVQLRICTTGEVMVNLVLGEDNFKKTEPLLQHLLAMVPAITTLLYTVNTKMNDSLTGLSPVLYHGKGYVIEMLEDFRFKIGPLSFFQTNTYQGEALYQVSREFAELTGKETVYDLYCGTGSIGIFVSRLAGKIIGVEMIEEAIADARENAAMNDLKDAEFYAGDVIDICNDAFFEKHGRPDVIITDPPRAGMHEKLTQKILDMAAPVVVYVSCNPATQARDLNLLGEKYEVTKIQPVDMFPQTHHIENVVQLKLRK